ncbi:hypothetical protein AB1283_00610 [Bacillus sp. S13(2024)]|uniref:hypothetical protein n=1 Tax=Bacillus sp. S13(2024) TaxID=3162885 RepID=UPI003D208469
MLNDYSSYAATFANGFITNLFSQGIINEVNAETLKKYFANPDQYQKDIENLVQYYYISSAEIHQLYELIEALPTLNYKIDSFDKNKSSDKHISIINKILHKVKHKRLTRDLLKQTTASGTLVGTWLGDKNNLYPYIFDDIKYVFPADRRNGEWLCVVDMNFFKEMSDTYRSTQLSNLSPYITQSTYDNFLKDTEKYRYVELPQDRTFVLRTGTLKRNQGLGTSWATSGMYDVLHKKKLKDVERSIANKIINAVAVLTIGHIGSDKNNDYTNMKLPKAVKQKVHSGVKAALEKNSQNGVTVVSVPDFAKIEFPDVKTDGLGGKFDDVNSDIRAAYGLYSSENIEGAKLSIETLYKRLAVLLEDIESEVYQKLINLILPSSQVDNYYISYDKEAPLTLKEKVNILSKLNDKGWSVKHLVDSLSGVSWEAYLEQTLYETDVLKLQERIKPYLSSFTSTGNDIGRPSNGDNSSNSDSGNIGSSDGNNTSAI